MRQYKWFAFASAGGQPFASGPHNSEGEAQDAIYKINDIDGEPVYRRYRTVQLSEAKRIYKYEISQKTGSMGLSLRPIRTSRATQEQKDCTKGVYD